MLSIVRLSANLFVDGGREVRGWGAWEWVGGGEVGGWGRRWVGVGRVGGFGSNGWVRGERVGKGG